MKSMSCCIFVQLPIHEFLQVGGKFVCHLFVLAHRGMPIGSITEATIVWREVEAIDFGIALLVGIVGSGVHCLLGGAELVTIHHASAEEDYLGIGVVGTDLVV